MELTSKGMGLCLVTGGTGLLGSHVAEQLSRIGVPLRALCREGSDVSFLESLGGEIAYGDITDPAAVERACRGVDAVFHAAARVGDWGPWPEFVRVTVEGTQRLLDAAAKARVRRFLHFSSTSVYGPVEDPRILDEGSPTGVNLHRWGYYSRSKVEAENRVWAAHRAGLVQATVMRPSWLYGARDRATMPRLAESIRRGRVRLVGPGDNRVNVVHAGNVAEASILAAQTERAIGEVYNCSYDGVLTQREYVNAVAKALGAPPITRSVPYGAAKGTAFALECFGRLVGRREPPMVTRYAVWLMGRRCFFECRKIKEHLGWDSTVGYETGIRDAVAEFLRNEERSGKPIGA